MKNVKFPRIMIVGTGSGCGKTTLTCGLLWAFKARGLKLSAFKCGPDYIDPMFHREVLGVGSHNLDTVLTKEEGVNHILHSEGSLSDLGIIEGVMGMYDGRGGGDEGSSNAIAQLTATPEILVVSPKGIGFSIGAVIKGYETYRPNRLKAVILNNTSERMYDYYKRIIESESNLEVLGYLPSHKELTVESRHLGLVTAGEIDDIKEKLAKLGELCERTLNLDRILEIAKEAEELRPDALVIEKPIEGRVKVALAWDKAFCFCYEAGLKVLETMGVELVRFSPLEAAHVPKDCCGLILPGGYPELYAKELEDNQAMKTAIKTLVEKGLPTIAECGGYMYLCKSIEDLEGRTFEMAGVIDHRVKQTKALVRFGYGELIAQEDGLLAAKGQTLLAHEFHYSDTDKEGRAFVFKRQKNQDFCGEVSKSLHAVYPHLHFLGNLEGARRFVEAAKAWEKTWN